MLRDCALALGQSYGCPTVELSECLQMKFPTTKRKLCISVTAVMSHQPHWITWYAVKQANHKLTHLSISALMYCNVIEWCWHLPCIFITLQLARFVDDIIGKYLWLLSRCVYEDQLELIVPCMTSTWIRGKLDAILQTTCSEGFSWIKIYQFRLRLHWILFPVPKLTIFQHWFR